MDTGSIALWLVVVAVAVIVVVAAVRARRSRRHPGTPVPGSPPPTDEDNYLDSSHISGPIVHPRQPGDTDRR